MSRSLCLSFACFALTVPLCAGEAKEWKIIASAQDSPREASIGPIHLAQPGTVVIRSAEELVALTSKPASSKDTAVQKEMGAELARLLEVEAVDWSKQMVLAVRGEMGT